MWIITKDHIADPEYPEGTNANAKGKTSGDYDGRKLSCKFRMYDDDGELYYEGLSDDMDSEEAFEPLDNFGMPNAGCTEIRYLRGRKWETL